MASTGDNPAVILQVKEGDQNRRVCATVLHLHTSSSEEKQNPAADLRRSIPSELTVTGYKRSQGPSAQQQEGANGSHHGLPNGKKVGTLSLHSSSVSQERDVKEYRRFMEYLFHGLAGTSPPKVRHTERKENEKDFSLVGLYHDCCWCIPMIMNICVYSFYRLQR